MSMTPYPPTVEPFFSTAIQLDEGIRHRLSCEPTSPDICTVCPQAGEVPCPDCRLVHYCSGTCLEKDRPIHGLFCQSFKLVSADKRPFSSRSLGLRYFRAILIPESGKPRWTWVSTTPNRRQYFLEHLYSGLPSHGLTQHSQSLQLGYYSARVPKHGIVSTTRNQLSRGESRSSINKFLQSLGPLGHLTTHWGPLIVLAFKASKGTDPQRLWGIVEDVEMADVAHIFHTLMHNLRENPCVVDVARYPHKTIPAVKINCFGDRRRFHPDKDPSDDRAIYEVVTAPNLAWHSSIQWPSIFAFTLGLPWICRRVHYNQDFYIKAGPEDKGEWAKDGDSLDNPALGCLHTIFQEPGRFDERRPLGEQMVPARLDRDDNLGTVLILHMYGEVIPAEHLKMFQLFCKETNVINLGMSKPEQAARVFHKAAFREFWDAKKKESAVPGMNLTVVPSPYAWEDKSRNEGNVDYMENSQQRADYEKLFKQAKSEPVVFGYIPSEWSAWETALASLIMEGYIREFGSYAQP